MQNVEGIFLGGKISSMTSRKTLSSKSPVWNQKHFPSTSHSWQTFNKNINTKLSGYFPYVKKHHPWHQWWPCPPCLRSGTLNVLQVPPLLTPLPADALLIKISTQNFHSIFLREKIIHVIKEDPDLHVSNQEPSTSSKSPPSWSPFLTHLQLRYQSKIYRVRPLG